jgi:bifunctional non-homologous end joining protein LigD
VVTPTDVDTVPVAGRGVRISSPARVMWPAANVTKSELIDYLLAIAPVLLPHLRGRPVTLRRFPEGVDGPGWYQTECRGAPDWVPWVEVRGARGGGQRYCRIEEPAALAWAANRGAIEIHPLPTATDRLGEPTGVIVDLDPGPPASVVEACRVAVAVRDVLVGAGLEPVAKTSGSRGLHVVAALQPGHSFATTKAYVRRLAEGLRDDPALGGLVVVTNDRAARTGRVLVDWVANDLVRSIAAPYSPRALAWPTVSTPLTWDEVAAIATGHQPAAWFLPDAVLDRVARHGDLFAPALGPGGRLPVDDRRSR